MSPDSPVRRWSAQRALWLAVLIAALTCAAVASVMFGVREIGFADAWSALTGHTDSLEAAAAAKRIPRTILAALVGAALAVSGTVMQGVTRNPLADPGILGVLSGASLAVVVGLAFFQVRAPIPTMVLAICGAAAAAGFVYFIGSLGGGGATPLKLALAGAATSTAISALISSILLPRIDVMDVFRHWQIGGVAGADYERMRLAAPFLLAGFITCWLSAGGLNALALGDAMARGLGEHASRTRLLASLGAVVLCGIATALAGPIGFVGLIVPHVMRLLIGANHHWLIPVSAVAGALLLTCADTVGRVITKPTEIAVGVIMPLIGAPLFIWIVRRQKVREL